MFTVPGRLTLAGLLLTSGESALKRCVNQRKIGSCYENLAADFLTEHGLHIRERNYRTFQKQIKRIKVKKVILI